MPRTKHGFCTVHRIAYLRSLDATCPQCTLAGLSSPQLDYDPEATQNVAVTVGAPLDASGKALTAAALDKL